MKFPALFICVMIITASCKNSGKASPTAAELNEQSLQCIRVMNDAEQQKNAAIAAGDDAGAAALQKTIDSAAAENAKIGQQLSELK